MSDLPFAALAEVLEPDTDARATAHTRSSPSNHPAPVSIRQAAQVQDFAFAETVSARELGDDAPPSTPIFFDDGGSTGHCVTPLAFPLPPAAADVDLRTRLRVGSAHVRHGVRGAFEEMGDLWRGAGEIVDSEVADGARLPPASRAGLFFRKLRAFWSCFQWSGGDVARAALIGAAVLVVATTAFVSTRPSEESSDERAATASGAPAEVRAAHTLEQHTGRKLSVRNKR